MFTSKLKKAVGFGLALCIVLTTVFSAPVNATEADYDATRKIILPCDEGGEG